MHSIASLLLLQKIDNLMIGFHTCSKMIVVTIAIISLYSNILQQLYIKLRYISAKITVMIYCMVCLFQGIRPQEMRVMPKSSKSAKQPKLSNSYQYYCTIYSFQRNNLHLDSKAYMSNQSCNQRQLVQALFQGLWQLGFEVQGLGIFAEDPQTCKRNVKID